VGAASNPNPNEAPGLEKEKRGEVEVEEVVVLALFVPSVSSIATAKRRWGPSAARQGKVKASDGRRVHER
jgi:hypothetical protein